MSFHTVDRDKVVSSIRTDPNFFNPEYFGTSEAVAKNVVVAHATIAAMEFERVRHASGLARQLYLLIDLLKGKPDVDETKALGLGEIIVGRSDISKQAGVYQAGFAPGDQSAAITQLQETHLNVSSDPTKVKVHFQ